MDCDECIERIFELIEEEASDPERVQAILERCPECRSLFEETKASLALGAKLPLDEPPEGLDAAIRRAAQERVLAPARKPRLPWVPRAPHWAMAAVALLAIGLGIWSRPRDVRMEDELPAAYELDRQTAEDSLETVQEVPRPEQANPAAMKALPPQSSDETELEVAADLEELAPASPRKAGRSEERRVRSKSKREASGQPASRAVAKTPAVPAASAEPAGAAAESAAAPAEMRLSDAEAADTRTAKVVERPDETFLRDCREMIAAQARRNDRAAVDSAETVEPVEAEAQLRLGRCYRQLGDREKARLWLERAEKQPATRERASAELRALAAEPK